MVRDLRSKYWVGDSQDSQKAHLILNTIRCVNSNDNMGDINHEVGYSKQTKVEVLSTKTGGSLPV